MRPSDLQSRFRPLTGWLGRSCLVASALGLLVSSWARAVPRPSGSVSHGAWVPEVAEYAPDAAWSTLSPWVEDDLAQGRPLVVEVFIPLCSNDQIDCGSGVAGRPGSLRTNLYWGAVFGARRFLERRGSGWTRLDLSEVDDVELQRAVYRRTVPARRWGLSRSDPVELIAVLHAIHGSSIEHAVTRFWNRAAGGGSVTFHDGNTSRTERVHAVGYAGHNRLLDGMKLPPAQRSWEPVPAFVLACYSERYLANPLLKVGSQPLVMTRALMAPEGYLLDAVLRGLGDNQSTRELRARAVRTYAKWQRLGHGQASGIFAPR
jgi:hypothetical protein